MPEHSYTNEIISQGSNPYPSWIGLLKNKLWERDQCAGGSVTAHPEKQTLWKQESVREKSNYIEATRVSTDGSVSALEMGWDFQKYIN